MGNTVITESQKLLTESLIQFRPGKKIRDYQQIGLFKDVNPLDWEDWHWQMKSRITKIEQISQVLTLTQAEEEGLRLVHCSDHCPVCHLRSRADLRARCLSRSPWPDLPYRVRIDVLGGMAYL